jgi:uncharacterized protein (TIGR01244 family)
LAISGNRHILSAFLLSVVFATACAAQPAVAPPLADEAQPAVRPAEWAKPIDPNRNLYQITPWLYRSTQPEQSDAAQLKKLGIRTIINFRVNHRDEDVLNLSGVKLVRIPMDAWDVSDDQIVSALRAIEQARKDGPVLIHCHYGADRTGTVSAMYRIIKQGWTPRQAIRELKHGGYGFHSIWFNLPHYIKNADSEKLRARLAQTPEQEQAEKK